MIVFFFPVGFRRADSLVFSYVLIAVSDWSQNLRSHNRATGVRARAAAQADHSRIRHGRPSRILPRQRRCDPGSIGRAMLRTPQKRS